MPLHPIPNDPLGFSHHPPTGRCEPLDYCLPVVETDHLISQLVQTPCSQAETCDGNFEEISPVNDIVGNWTHHAFQPPPPGGSIWEYGTLDPQAFLAGDINHSPGQAYRLILHVKDSVLHQADYLFRLYCAGVRLGEIKADGRYEYFFNAAETRFILIEPIRTHIVEFKIDVSLITLNLVSPCWQQQHRPTERVPNFDFNEFPGAWSLPPQEWSWHPSGYLQWQADPFPGTHIASTALTLDMTREAIGEVQLTNFSGTGGVRIDIDQEIIGSFNNIGTYSIHLQASQLYGVTDRRLEIVPVPPLTSFRTQYIRLWQVNGGWILGNGARHTPGYAWPLETGQPVLQAGLVYELSFRITDMTAGEVTPYAGSVMMKKVSTNGYHKRYFQAVANDVIGFHPSADFDGTIIEVSWAVLKTDYQLFLLNANNQIIANLSSHVYYHDTEGNLTSYVTVNVPVSEILVDGEPLQTGCYRLRMDDDCNMLSGNIWNDSAMRQPRGIWWDAPGQSPGVVEMHIEEGVMRVECFDDTNSIDEFVVWNLRKPNGGTRHFPDDIPLGQHDYMLELDVIHNDDVGRIHVGYILPDGTVQFSPSSVGHHQMNIYDFSPPFLNGTHQHWIGLVFRFLNVQGRIVIDNVRLYRRQLHKQRYRSICFHYDNKYSFNTLMLQAYCEGHAFGFNFNTGFRFQLRMRPTALNPSYDGNHVLIERSDSQALVAYARTSKKWQLWTELLPEPLHDLLRVMMLCTRFGIVNPALQLDEYVVERADYLPEWSQDGASNLAPVRLEIKRKDDFARYNVHDV